MRLAGVNLTHIVINEHAAIFAELIELLTETLDRLGHPVTVTANALVSDRLNVILGHTLFLPPEHFAAIRNVGAPYVIFQTEALDEKVGFATQQPAYIDFLTTARQIWDYSPSNNPFLTRRGCRDVRHIPIGHAARLERVAAAAQKDIDILFYGFPNPRRKQVLKELQSRGLKVWGLVGVYGPVRDQAIARAKIVLNIHQFETPHLEEIRLAYLLNNRCFVVSETCDRDPYQGGVVFCEYGGLVDRCLAYLRPGMEAERDSIAGAGHAALKGVPMAESLRAALNDCGARALS